MRKKLRNLLVVRFPDIAGAEQLLTALRQGERKHGLRLDKYAIILRDGSGQCEVRSERHISVRWSVLVGLGIGLLFALVNTIGLDVWPFIQQNTLDWVESLIPSVLHFVLVPILISAAVFASNEAFARARNYVGFLILGPNPNARQPRLLLGLFAAAVAGGVLAFLSTAGGVISMLLFRRVGELFPSLYASSQWIYNSVGFATDLLSRGLLFGVLGVTDGIALSQRVNHQFSRAELLQQAAMLALDTAALVAVVRFGDLSNDRSALDAIRNGTVIEYTLPEVIALRLGLPVVAGEQQPMALRSPQDVGGGATSQVIEEPAQEEPQYLSGTERSMPDDTAGEGGLINDEAAR